jgi:hypothetical protein
MLYRLNKRSCESSAADLGIIERWRELYEREADLGADSFATTIRQWEGSDLQGGVKYVDFITVDDVRAPLDCPLQATRGEDTPEEGGISARSEGRAYLPWRHPCLPTSPLWLQPLQPHFYITPPLTIPFSLAHSTQHQAGMAWCHQLHIRLCSAIMFHLHSFNLPR